MARLFVGLGAAIGFAALVIFVFLVYVLLASGQASYWEGDIAEFERRDISNPPPTGAILFVGDRDIRRWDSLSADMAPMAVVQRGFGGAHLAHLTHYAARIIKPYDPAAIVVMAGGADLADVRGYRPEDVLEDFKIFVSAVRAHGIMAPIYFVSIRPSPLRESRWFGAKRANRLIETYANSTNGLHYIDVANDMFAADGSMRSELFNWDGLSLSEEGYALLAKKIRPVLAASVGTHDPDAEPIPR